MTPQELSEAWDHALEHAYTHEGPLKRTSQEVLTLIVEVRRLRVIKEAAKLFAFVVPPCECGAYEHGTKPCSANCRIDVKFRQAVFGETEFSP